MVSTNLISVLPQGHPPKQYFGNDNVYMQIIISIILYIKKKKKKHLYSEVKGAEETDTETKHSWSRATLGFHWRLGATPFPLWRYTFPPMFDDYDSLNGGNRQLPPDWMSYWFEFN